MKIDKLTVGPIMANCFIVGCQETAKAAVIDPGAEVERILAVIEKSNYTVDVILNTHGHFDHVSGNNELQKFTGAPILIHALDEPMLTQLSASAARWGLDATDSPPPERTIADGDVIQVGTLEFKVIHTPGHTPGGVSFLCGQDLFVGDTLFSGSVGRTDFPGGDYDTLMDSIRRKLYPLGDEVRVYTGHGPETTLGHERRTNPFARGM